MTADPAPAWARSLSGVVDTALDRSVVGGFSSIGYAVRRRLPSWPADSAPGALAGRDVIVTGASSGLGTQTAVDLASLGAHVHLVVRDVAKGEATVRALEGAADADGEHPAYTVWKCDVSDLGSVRAFAERFLAAGHRLAGIVHNAGSMPATWTPSAQGHELTMALHVLGPVLMTELLLPALTGESARVVFVTSGGMYAQALREDDPEFRDGEYSGTVAYARSKRAQVELLGLLGERWRASGVALYATHPGWAATPGVSESIPGFERVMRPVLRDVAAGADTTAWLMAVEPRPVGGGLWHDRRARPTSFMAKTRPREDQRMRMLDWVLSAAGLSG